MHTETPIYRGFIITSASAMPIRPRKSLAALLLAVLLLAGCRTLSPLSPPGPPSRPGAFAEVDRLLESYRERGAFPGGVLAVGFNGAPIHLHPFGRLSYDMDAPPVTAGTLYDLASLTKVVATTTMAMILVDEGRLDLDQPVWEVLPGFQGPGKEAVTVRHYTSRAGDPHAATGGCTVGW